jgi:CcmD family protein
VQNLGYLVAAYLILWLGLFGYLFWMSGALRGLRAELSELRAAQRAQEDEVRAVPAVAMPTEPIVAPSAELRGR